MDYLELNRIYLLMFALHSPLKNWNFFQILLYYIWRVYWLGSLSLSIIFVSLDIFYRDKIESVQEIGLNIMNIVLFLSVTVRSVLFLFFGETIEKFMDDLNSNIVLRSPLVENGRTMETTKKFSEKLAHFWIFFTFTATIYINLNPLLSEGRNLPLPLWLFFDWRRDEIYLIIFLITSIANIFMSTTFGCTDIFHTSCMVYMADQFLILEESINNVVPNAFRNQECNDEEIKEFLTYEDSFQKIKQKRALRGKFDRILLSKDFKECLKQNMFICTEHHQTLLNLVKQYEDFMAPLLLIEYQGIFAYFIFMLFCIAITNDHVVLFGLIHYLTGSVTQIFMLCYFGERLTTNSIAVRGALYNLPWYMCDEEFLEIFKIMQIRTIKIIEIKAGKVLPLTLESFLKFMRKAFSFFTVLRQMY